MDKTITLRARILLAMLCVLILPAWAQSSDCSCNDVKDLLNRLNEVDAAIQEYEFQAEGIKASEKTGGKVVKLTAPIYDDELQPRVKAAIMRVTGHGLTGGGETSSLLCNSEITSKSACLGQGVSRHEQVHHAVCAGTSFLEKVTKDVTLFEMVQEEISAFNEERNFILAALKSMPTMCRPKGWFGFVVYEQTDTTDINQPGAPKNTAYKNPGAGAPIITSANESSTFKTDYTGSIFVTNSKTSDARAGASQNLDYQSKATGRIYCSVKKPDIAFSTLREESTSSDGSSSGVGTFALSLDSLHDSYSITVGFPEIPIAGKTSITSNTNPCGKDPYPVANAYSARISAQGYTMKGKTRAGTDVLSGSTVDQPPLLQVKNATMSRSLVTSVRWMLDRIDK